MYFIFLIHKLKLLGSVLGIIKLKVEIIITFNKKDSLAGALFIPFLKGFLLHLYSFLLLPMFIEITFRINWARRKLKTLSTQVNL